MTVAINEIPERFFGQNQLPAVAKIQFYDMIIVGVIMLAYVASQYYGMYSEQKRWSTSGRRAEGATVRLASQQIRHDGLIRFHTKDNLDAIVLDGTTRRQLKNGLDE